MHIHWKLQIAYTFGSTYLHTRASASASASAKTRMLHLLLPAPPPHTPHLQPLYIYVSHLTHAMRISYDVSHLHFIVHITSTRSRYTIHTSYICISYYSYVYMSYYILHIRFILHLQCLLHITHASDVTHYTCTCVIREIKCRGNMQKM